MSNRKQSASSKAPSAKARGRSRSAKRTDGAKRDSMQVIASGQGEFLAPDPDGFRRFIRDNKVRNEVDKRMSAQEAVQRFVQDGNYITLDGNMGYRGPNLLLREVIRQRKRDLWVAAGPGTNEIPLLVAAGCVSRVDVGWMDPSPVIQYAMREGRLKVVEWSNGGLSYRHLAGAMGVPFLPVRFLGGSGAFEHSGAKLIKDPFTGENLVLVPAINPDVALIHVHQSDRFGNCRVFGPGFAPAEKAGSAKRVIISTEEIIEPAEIRRLPGLTTIPHYIVDAVVHAPFGAYPGGMPGMYHGDGEHMGDLAAAQRSRRDSGLLEKFLEKWIYSVASDEEMLEKHVERETLSEMRTSNISEAFGV